VDLEQAGLGGQVWGAVLSRTSFKYVIELSLLKATRPLLNRDDEAVPAALQSALIEIADLAH
jgi:hypothetical protein